MKLKPTPFFLASLGLFLYGLYWLLIADTGEEGWGKLLGIIIIGYSFVLYLVYILFRAIFKKSVWTQSGVETLLLCGALFYYYKTQGEFSFALPKNFKGHVLLVYNVEGHPVLPANVYSNKVRLNVPVSGIIITSSLPLNEKYYRGATFSEDGKNISKLEGSSRRHDLVLGSDTLICNGRKYYFEKWIIKDQPDWTLRDDTLYNLNGKLQAACDLINRTIAGRHFSQAETLQ